MTESQTDPYRVRVAIERVVFDLLSADSSGAEVLVRVPIGAGVPGTYAAPADYRAGITAARTVAREATGLIRQWAVRARGEGHTWADLAAPLGIDAEQNRDPAGAAFALTAGESRSISWKCNACGQWVSDRGPYIGDPAEDEQGHAEACQRFRADVEAYRILHS